MYKFKGETIMKNFIEVHTNYTNDESKTMLVNVAHITTVLARDTKTYIGILAISGDSDGFSADSIPVMESYNEVKQAIIMAQSN